jgi:hypothetical protein
MSLLTSRVKRLGTVNCGHMQDVRKIFGPIHRTPGVEPPTDYADPRMPINGQRLLSHHRDGVEESESCTYEKQTPQVRDFNLYQWYGCAYYRGERFWLDPEWLYERMMETLNATRPNQRGGGWHTKQSYIALVLEQIGIYRIFGETSGNVQQWLVPKEIYEALQRRVTRLDDQNEVIGPWK